MGFLSSLHFISSFFYNQLLVTLPVPTKSFEGQTIVVTGSNTGLGLEAARHISRLNAKLLILAVRNTSKGEAAKASILASTHRPESSIQVWELDLHSFESIKRFADRAKGLERLDAVLENAGIVTKYFTLVEGYENTIMTNVISTFLLALLVLPKLRETAELVGRDTHLAVVASDLHFMARFVEGSEGDIFGALNKRENFKASMERYVGSCFCTCPLSDKSHPHE
jgi:retinol dehydrogenase-12